MNKREDFSEIKKTFKFPKPIEMKVRSNTKITLKQRDFREFYGKNDKELEEYYSLLYDLIDVFNGKYTFNEEINKNISIILNRLMLA